MGDGGLAVGEQGKCAAHGVELFALLNVHNQGAAEIEHAIRGGAPVLNGVVGFRH